VVPVPLGREPNGIEVVDLVWKGLRHSLQRVIGE